PEWPLSTSLRQPRGTIDPQVMPMDTATTVCISQRSPARHTEPTTTAPGERLEALAVRVRLHRTEWRVIAIVLTAPRPLSLSRRQAPSSRLRPRQARRA